MATLSSFVFFFFFFNDTATTEIYTLSLHDALPIWIIGTDDSAESCTALYHDSRGVARVYRMSLDAGLWRIWRDAPGFCQRYAGRLDADGGSIRGAWEKSADGSVWEKDFDMFYTKV